MLPDLPPPTLVTDLAQLETLVEELRGQREIAVDTEADSFYSYREKVCLLQISAGERDWLVDPLRGLDLAPLGPVFADRRITKVFHDGEYDILILKRDHGLRFEGLYDTRVAAAALGMQAPGLAAVLQERFRVELDKSMQRSNWAKRPLSEQQVSYARLDTHYLVRLMHELRAELAERGRERIVESEFRRLERLEPPVTHFEPDEFARLKGVRTLQPAQRRALRELFVLRERLAEAADAPPFRIMNNQLLIELAQAQPRSEARLLEIKGFTERLVRRIGPRVLETLRRASQMPPIERLPALPRRDGTADLDEAELELFDRLKRLRKELADAQEIESAYLLNRLVLVRIARERPHTMGELAAIEGVQDWQLEMFGERLLETVARFDEEIETGLLRFGRGRRRR